MDSTSADSQKTSRRRHPKASKKVDGSCTSQASSSSAGSSLSSSRVSTPSLTAAASSSTSASTVATSSSSTAPVSDSRVKFHYDRDELMKLQSVHLSCVRPAGLGTEHETVEGVWDPDHWFTCMSPALGEKRKQLADMEHDASQRKRPSGNGLKSGGAVETNDDDDEHISLAPQRNSFLTGCQVKRSAAGADSKRDGRDRREAMRIGSGRIQIGDKLGDKESRRDERGGRFNHDRHRDADGGDRRRADADADDAGKGRYSRDVENSFGGRLDRGEWYDRDDSRANKMRHDRDRDDARFDFRRKDGNMRHKSDYMDRRDGDRRGNRMSGYSYESTGACYGRNYAAAAEPEWYTEGPISQSDTIELHGFDVSGERSRTRHASGSDVAQESSRPEGQKTREDGAAKSGSRKSKENTEAAVSRSRDGDAAQVERSEQKDCGTRENGASGSTNKPTLSSHATSEFDFNNFFCIDDAALGLGLDGVSNSAAGSRLWQWAGRSSVDESSHLTSAADSKAAHHDGVASEMSSITDTKSLLSLLQKSDHQTPSLPSVYLDSRLAPQTSEMAPVSQGNVVANVQALLDSASLPSMPQPVLPAGGKVVTLEELEASQFSPTSQPPVPSASSTPADKLAVTSGMVDVTRDLMDARRRRAVPAQGQQPAAAAAAGPLTHGRLHAGPAESQLPAGSGPSVPVGAQTLEEIEAAMRGMNLPPSPPVNSAASVRGSAAGSGLGDLSAFNKLLHLVHKNPAGGEAGGSSADSAATGGPAAVSSAVTVAYPEPSQAAGVTVQATDAIDDAAVIQQQQKLHQLQQQQMYLQQQHQMLMRDPQLLMAYLQRLPSQAPQQPPPPPHQQQLGNTSPQMFQQPQQMRCYSPRAPSPIIFGSQPPISIAAPLPIHSRQRLPFSNISQAPVPLQAQPMVAVPQPAAVMQLAAVHSALQKQRQAQIQQQQTVMLPNDRTSAGGVPAASQLPGSVPRTAGTSFIPTSVIRNMAGQRATDDKLVKDGETSLPSDGQTVVKDGGYGALHRDGTALRPAAADNAVNGPVSYTAESLPNSHQMHDQNRQRRPLIGQGQGAVNTADVLPPVSNIGASQQGVISHAPPVGRPIVKGQVPFNMSSSVTGMPGPSNCLPVESMQLMSQLAHHQHPQQLQQQHRPNYPHVATASFLLPQQFAVSSSHVGLQHQLQAERQAPAVRSAMQPGLRPVASQPLKENAGKQNDAISRLLASGVADRRLPSIPAQLAKTVDEIECGMSPTAN